MTLRPPLWYRLGYALALGFVAAVVALYVALGDAPPIALAGSLLAVAAAWRMWVVRVEVDREEVRLVGLTSTRVLAWSDIERFELDRNGTVAAWTHDGGWHRIEAFTGPAHVPWMRWHKEDAVRRLERARLRRATSS